jgi:hypothetical protein
MERRIRATKLMILDDVCVCVCFPFFLTRLFVISGYSTAWLTLSCEAGDFENPPKLVTHFAFISEERILLVRSSRQCSCAKKT